MKYHELLKEYIDKSNLTLDQIAEECKKYDVKVHPTYISKLRLGNRPPASYKVTVVLSKILGVEPEKLLAAGRNEESENEKQELTEALETIYPDMDYDNIYEKMMQIYVAYHQILEPREMLTPEEEAEFNEWRMEEEEREIPDLEKMLENKKLKWRDEELNNEERESVIEILDLFQSLDNEDRERAIELMKVFNRTKKDTN